MSDEAGAVDTAQVTMLPEGAKINLMAPRGMKLVDAKIFREDLDAEITWTQRGKQKTLTVSSSGRGRKVCDLLEADVSAAGFGIA